MLHGVRFLQSQLHARVAEFSLKDWLATFKEHELSDANVASHARKAHRDAKIHCFLSGLAVAVEGELPSRGLVLVAGDDVDFAVRVLSSLARFGVRRRNTPPMGPRSRFLANVNFKTRQRR